MKQVLFSLALATAGAILLVSIPSEGFYQPSKFWNGTRNSTYNGPGYVPYRNNSAHYYPSHGRYPRSTPYWGNSSQNASHNYFWGHKTAYDRLLYFSRVKKASSFMRKVTQDVEFPAKYQRANGTIYYMQILDQKPIGDGGEVSILKGGVGYQNVTFHFKSQRGKGFDFTVSIYGHDNYPYPKPYLRH